MKEDMKHLKFQDNRSPNFETPTWESWEKVPFGCNPFKESQNILQGKDWCFFPKVVVHVKLVLKVVLIKFTMPFAFNLH